jgi:hypothetical protein
MPQLDSVSGFDQVCLTIGVLFISYFRLSIVSSIQSSIQSPIPFSLLKGEDNHLLGEQSHLLHHQAMPQLDSLSWFDQVGSTVGVIFIFYFLLTLLFLPALSAITKGRFKLLNLRKVLNTFYTHQINLLVQAGHQNLAIFIFNNLYVVDAYYTPVFSADLQNELLKNSFTLTDSEIIENIFTDKSSINFINLSINEDLDLEDVEDFEDEDLDIQE